jgi:hypothetical protein
MHDPAGDPTTNRNNPSATLRRRRERILEIADDSSRDYVQKTGADGKVTWVEDKEHIADPACTRNRPDKDWDGGAGGQNDWGAKGV